MPSNGSASGASEDTELNRSDKKVGLGRRAVLGGIATAVGLVSLPRGVVGQHRGQRDIDEIISNMSLDDKISMLHQHPGGIIPALPDHGIPEIGMRDGPNGVRGPKATAFPTNIAAASTFDPTLIKAEGAAIAREAKADGANVLLAPASNINRVPVGGRTFEYYSEDPHLSASMAAAFTNGVQSEEIVATVKHYVANNQEHSRDSIDVDVSERAEPRRGCGPPHERTARSNWRISYPHLFVARSILLRCRRVLMRRRPRRRGLPFAVPVDNDRLAGDPVPSSRAIVWWVA